MLCVIRAPGSSIHPVNGLKGLIPLKHSAILPHARVAVQDSVFVYCSQIYREMSPPGQAVTQPWGKALLWPGVKLALLWGIPSRTARAAALGRYGRDGIVFEEQSEVTPPSPLGEIHHRPPSAFSAVIHSLKSACAASPSLLTPSEPFLSSLSQPGMTKDGITPNNFIYRRVTHSLQWPARPGIPCSCSQLCKSTKHN